MIENCIFCELPDERIQYESDLWLVVRDGYPVSPGHTLIIPKRHVKDFFEINEHEHSTLQSVINISKEQLDKELKPDGYNIGINCGAEAGQTVFHLHIHLIPRYKGDRDDPRGGVRWIMPDKADYGQSDDPYGNTST